MTVKRRPEEEVKRKPLRFQRHTSILIWKCYLQRQRRCGLLLVEAGFAAILFLTAVFIAKPVFLTPLQDEPEPPLTSADILASLHSNNIIGYAPNIDPYVTVMNRAATLLGIEIMSAQSEDDLNEMLYNQSDGTSLKSPIIWIIWSPNNDKIWHLHIRSTERASYVTAGGNRQLSNPHLRAGFLAVQLAISQSIIEFQSPLPPDYELNLVSMPVSPLMSQTNVRKALSGILLCFTLALIPPVLETEALVVSETVNMFKRALRLRNVGYASMYVAWVVYAYLTALPICVLGAVTLILIFRWIHLLAALLVLLAYVSIMIMIALLMGMFHSKAYIACIWTTLFTLLQTYLSELLVHHQYDLKHTMLTFVLHLVLPPLGLVNALNEFALLQTGREPSGNFASLVYMLGSWALMILLYFGLLMLLQRTIGQRRAIGGQVSWKSIIFKQIEDVARLHVIETPSGNERQNLQEVDEFLAKAISFRDVSKSIMEIPVLRNITFDIYRGEFTILFVERIQERLMMTLDDLLTGLTVADRGTINVLGETLKAGTTVMTSRHMMGYCHRSATLIDDLTVNEHFVLFTQICLWHQRKINIFEYGTIRSKRLMKECDLELVKHERVRNLNVYYRAQLCWALAMLLEPRIVIIPNFTDVPTFVKVIKDKIMNYKKYITIVALYYASIQLEYADRVFVFDTRVLVFGGTPAYMFFKFGREYRVRMTLKGGGTTNLTYELLERAREAGATVRAHLGSLLILRLPANPSQKVAELVKDLTDNSNKYGLTSFNISVPDSEEVSRSLTEYLVTRAIDSPQLYVYLYAYGMDVATNENGTVTVQALYSPLHHDHGAAARSMARVFMALLRHYTGFLDATIRIDDDPLALDLSMWMKSVATPPLFVQFLLILSISHITLLPSKEYGLVRHLQMHAMNFSPFRYWFSMYFCDLLLYWILVAIMSCVMISIMFVSVPISHYEAIDLLVVPIMLLTYGIGCVPQAYVFSLGPRVALNTMTFVIINLVFGETTIVAKVFYGDALNYALDFMSLSPQFNMAYAYVKIKQIFLYNSECITINTMKVCSLNIFHKCCQKCGVLQDCFKRKHYFTRNPGVVMEIIAMFTTAAFFMVLLMFIEYRIFQRMWTRMTSRFANRDRPPCQVLMPGAEREMVDVLAKRAQLKNKRADKVDTFGEYLLAADLTYKDAGLYAVHNVFLGIGKGEALAVSGLRRHGRLKLCEMLAGYKCPSYGNAWCMSKHKLKTNPHNYIKNISLSSDRPPLPSWLKVQDGLSMIAALRGVPRSCLKKVVTDHMDSLDLLGQANTYIGQLPAHERPRLHFAAAVIGAPPIIVLDECTANQRFSVRRAMYSILYTLRKQGHAIIISSSSIESHMPVTNRLAIIRDGHIYDVDSVDNLVERYSKKGYTVVVHLKDEIDVIEMFSKYFNNFSINDTSDVLVNVQVFDCDLTWALIFEKMEVLKSEHNQVYSYIVTVIPIDYIYNSIINNEMGNKPAKDFFSSKFFKKVMSNKPEVKPDQNVLNKLTPFEQKYDITKLKELPWSVIFHR